LSCAFDPVATAPGSDFVGLIAALMVFSILDVRQTSSLSLILVHAQVEATNQSLSDIPKNKNRST
jgi:hypothetical protein